MERLTNFWGNLKKCAGCSESSNCYSNHSCRNIAEAIARLRDYEDFEEIFRSKMTDATCDSLKDKEEFAKWIDRNKWIVKKCDEYAGAEEQGKLLKLPCKSGQKVFLLRKDIKSVIDGEITSIRIGEFASDMKIFIIDDNRYTEASFDKIGDIVFFTREAAEVALKELEGKKE